MTLDSFLQELKSKYYCVPFIPDIEGKDIDFPEGCTMPLTEEVFKVVHGDLRPSWQKGSSFVYTSESEQVRLFWKDKDDYYGLEMTQEETQAFWELA